jgi:hypothetical protein
MPYSENQNYSKQGDNIMLDKIKSTVKSPEFQRQAAHVAGGVVSIVATAIISNLVSKGIDAGIDAVMDKIHPTTEVTVAE